MKRFPEPRETVVEGADIREFAEDGHLVIIGDRLDEWDLSTVHVMHYPTEDMEIDLPIDTDIDGGSARARGQEFSDVVPNASEEAWFLSKQSIMHRNYNRLRRIKKVEPQETDDGAVHGSFRHLGFIDSHREVIEPEFPIFINGRVGPPFQRSFQDEFHDGIGEE